MNEIYSKRFRKSHIIIWLFLGMLVYKFSMDLGFLYLNRISNYSLSFDPLKYALGFFWCVLLFIFIRHTEPRASSFFLYFVFLFQIVPITTIYGLGEYSSTAYYNILCLGFLLCELIVGCTKDPNVFRRNFPISRTMTLGYTAAALLLIVYIIVKNGTPHLSLLNVFAVYEYRRSGILQISKYMHYLLDWTTKVFIPFGIASSLVNKRYLRTIFVSGMLLLLYFYTGNKTSLFAVPFILIGALWSKRENFYQELFLVGCAGFCFMTIFACLSNPGGLWYYIFSLFGERLFIVSAQNKFLYYDYFFTHPKLGLAEIFPRWLISIPNPYLENPYPFDISTIYYNKPEMYSNTGFLAEGYMRFGHIGTLLILLLFALLLKQIDHFQERTSYSLCIGLFIYPFLCLSDGHLLDSFILGNWMFLIAILWFYIPGKTPFDLSRHSLKHKKIVLQLRNKFYK